MNRNGIYLALAAGLPASSAFAAQEKTSAVVESLMRLTSAGATWVLWLLIGLSIVSVAVMMERIFFFRRRRIHLDRMQARLHAHLSNDEWDAAAEHCRRSTGFEARVAEFAIENRHHGGEALEQMLDGVEASLGRELDRGLTFLGTLGNNAPFLGLFGTVLGIIEAFHTLSLNPAGGAAVVMSGISEALIATAIGLAVALPAVVAFNVFQRQVRSRREGARALRGLVLGHVCRTSNTLARVA